VFGVAPESQEKIVKDDSKRVRRTFGQTWTIGSGKDQVDLRYFGRAHTGGDAFVIFPALRVMHVGDTFPTRTLPIMDRNNGGTGVGYSSTIAKRRR
jgi:glyoxylase-like metal-dependent hydrolase (beta-lactamase superfamily II)